MLARAVTKAPTPMSATWASEIWPAQCTSTWRPAAISMPMRSGPRRCCRTPRAARRTGTGSANPTANAGWPFVGLMPSSARWPGAEQEDDDEPDQDRFGQPGLGGLAGQRRLGQPEGEAGGQRAGDVGEPGQQGGGEAPDGQQGHEEDVEADQWGDEDGAVPASAPATVQVATSRRVTSMPMREAA